MKFCTGNVGPTCNNNHIIDVIHGLGIKTDQIKVQETPLKSGNDKKAFKASAPYINHPEVIVALMSCDQNLIVEKFRITKQQPSTRQAGGVRDNNNFRGSNPNKKSFKPNRQHQHQQHQQYQPNHPRWHNQNMPSSPNWNLFGPPPSMASFGPPGWRYQPNY